MATVSSTSLYGETTNSKAFGGLVSGLDTDDLVEKMTAGTTAKINKAYQAQQALKYKQEAYREVSEKLLAFSNKYFSYSSSSGSSILDASFFKAYKTESSSKFVSVSGDQENINNFSISDITSVATRANFVSSKKVTDGTFSSSEMDKTYASTLAGASMTIKYGTASYTLTLDKNFGRSDTALTLDDVAAELNKQIDKITDLNGGTDTNTSDNKLVYKVENNKLVYSNSDTTKSVSLTSASSVVLNSLAMKVGETPASTSEITAVQVASLSLKASDVIKDTKQYMTFDYNGVATTVNLVDTITSGADLASCLQSGLDKAYGAGKVTVTYGADNKLSFTAAGDSNLFGVSGISTNLRAVTGIDSTTYNRMNKTSAVTDAGIDGLDTTVDTYKMSINGTSFEFAKTMSMSDIMKEINNNTEAGVNVYYSSTTNSFTVKATETGSNKGVDIQDVTGNLAASLFGSCANNLLADGEYLEYDSVNSKYNIINSSGHTAIGTATYNKDTKQYTIDYNDGMGTDKTGAGSYVINDGTDTKMTYKMNGVTTTITRSTANFTIDGVSITLNENAKGTASDTTPITFTSTNDTDKVVERVKEFVKDYNEVLNLMSTDLSEKHDSDYDPLTPTQKEEMSEDEIELWEKEAKKGMLFGDSVLREIVSGFRGAATGKTTVSGLVLSDIGISAASYDTSGKLTFDEDAFVKALNNNPEEIASLFSGETSDSNSISGIAVQIKAILKKNIGDYGISGTLIDKAGRANSMTSDENYLSDRIEEYDDKLKELKEDLEDERTKYWKKFSNLETVMNNLNSQSSWLTSMLGS